jgi:iron complex outermembrane receptor protein/vitamin B12 transporter
MNKARRRLIRPFLAILLLASASGLVAAQEITGTVRDSLGAVVPKANVELWSGGQKTSATITDSSGAYRFAIEHAAHYQVRVAAETFAAASSGERYASANQAATIDLTLFPSAVKEEVVVTATGIPIPETQTGASVSVLDAASLRQSLEVQDALRVVPGAQLAQTGPLGGTTYLFVRGGGLDENKVLIDGVPINDIGGSVDFANIASSAIDRVEVFRGPNSALFGTDAMASVVDMRTRRGTTPAPQVSYTVQGGNFGTYRQEANLGGLWRQFDYFSDFARLDTRNNEPNSQFHNGTYAGNFGWNFRPDTEARVTVWRSVSNFNSANQLGVFGIPDDAWQHTTNLYIGSTIESKTTARWHNLLRYGAARLRLQYTDPTPSGIPFNSPVLGPVYLGAPVTLTGANGYSASGQAVFSYAGVYPSVAAYLTNSDFVYAQSDFTLNRHLALLGGFRYEDERGYTAFSSTNWARSETERGNYSYIMQASGGFWERAYYSVGAGIEDNAVFGVFTAPRASLAYYLVRPQPEHVFSGTRLKANFGKGVKEPSIYDQVNSLYGILKGLPNGVGLPLIQQYGVTPVAPQRSRSYDGGVDQQLFGGRARLGITYFHNEFDHELENVPLSFLPQLGVPAGLLPQLVANNFFSASVNSLAFRAQGVETELEYRWQKLAVRGGWTYLDAVVQQTFSSTAVFNPLFPNIPIGAFAPLVGGRPFRRAPQTGFMVLSWTQPRWTVSLSGTFVGSRDDSTYATDPQGGNSLLLPNRNLLAPYQRIDLGASYRVNSVLSLTASAQNLLSQHYQEAFGYPSLPFTFLSGIRLTFGGESWRKQ